MSEQPAGDNKPSISQREEAPESRRPVLRKLGKFAAVTAPAIALILSAGTKPAAAITSISPL